MAPESEPVSENGRIVDHGYRAQAERRARVLARASDSTRRRILGLPPLYLAEKTHAITVDLRTGERTVRCVADWSGWELEAGPARSPASLQARHSFVRIVEAVCAAWGLDPGELLTPSRSLRITRPRFAAFRMVHKLLRWSTLRIGRAFKRDHTSIVAGLSRATELYRRDPDWRRRYRRAHRALKPKGGR